METRKKKEGLVIKKIKYIAVLSILALTALSLPALIEDTTSAHQTGVGAVYVMTNQAAPAGNAVAVFSRAADGLLTPAGTFSTGGLGTGPQGPEPELPLRSQGALVLSEDDSFLFAVNAGSDEISVFAVEATGLSLLDKVSSGGVRPVSLTVNENLVYVLNGGGTPNITGFTISPKGKLKPLRGSTRPLSGGDVDPSQVEFSPDGRVLVVTEKATNLINTYTVGDDGLAGGLTEHVSNGLTPFGFGFRKPDLLIVSEAFGDAPNQGALSSYIVSEIGNLEVKSGSVPNFGTASCWIVVTDGGQYAYVSNTVSASISGYDIGRNGKLRLLDRDGRTAVTGEGSFPTDMALTNDSAFLYVLNGGNGTIGAFHVELDGSLIPLPGAGGLPSGAQGIAAR
ncbi:MAG TPA: beta-propeller fold lactonase family protein [Pyrinomonadaceae bacterium]|jgi:6-phosphogluconolactonase (cycloisomerase 2 family)